MADKTIPALKILRGKVGINIATPTQQLHVNGEAFISTGSTSVRTLSGIFKADTIENSAGASNLKLQTESGGNKHIEITPNGTGNVGINTNAPGAKIDVNGSAIFRGANSWAGNDSQGCSIYLSSVGYGVYGNFSNYARNLVKANSNYVEVGQNSTLVYGIKFRVGSNAPNGFMFQSNIGGTMTTHMSIRGNNGSVGIGTANPGSLLTISGNSDDGDNACALRIIDEDDTGGSKLPAIMFYGGSTIQGRIRGGDGTFAIAVGSTPTTAFSINTTSRKIAFGGYGSGTHTGTAAYKLAVDSSGNVIETAVGAGQVDGSGTANKLALWTDADTIGDSIITQSGTAYAQVNGGVRITGNHTDTGSQLNIWCDNSGHARAAAYDYFFYSGSNNSRSNLALFLSNNGSVGINTASPSAKLHVHSGNVVVTSGKQLISTNTYSQAPIGMLTIQGPTTGSTALTASQFGIVIGPQHTRSATANTYYPGIVFNHLLNHTGQSTYNSAPQAYIGTRLHDTSGSERDFLVFATKSGTGTSSSDVPIERMCIDPVYGSIGIGSTDPAAQLQIGRAQTTSAFTDSFIKLRPSNTTNSTGLTSITLGTSTVDNYGYSISGWRAGTDGSPYLRIQRHHNSAAGTDVMVMKNNGDAVFYGSNWYCNTNNSTNVSNGGLYINRGGGLYAYALATARSGTALNGVDFWDYHGVGLVFGPDSSTKVLTVKSNIGIGTTDPGYKLDVYGADARIGTNLRLGNGSAAGNSTNPAITSSGVTTAGVYFENSGVGFGAGSGSKYLFLSSAGNASLGGNGFFKQLGDRPYGTDNLNDYYRSNDEASFCQFYRYDATHGHWANSSGTLTTNAPSTLTQTTSQIYSYGSLLTLRSLNSFRGQFYFAHSASEFYWRSGWGTSSDQNWTRIVGDRNIQSVINNVGNITITSGTLTVNNTAIFGAAATKLKTYSDSTYSGIYNGSSLQSDEAIYFGSDNIYFYNGGSQSLQIDSNLRLQLKATDYQLRYTSGSHIWYNRLTSGGTFAIHKNGVGDYLSVTSAGNVGIGTNAPAQKLHVQGGAMRVNEGTSAVWMGEYQSGAVIWLDGANGDFTGGDYFQIRANNSGKLTFGYAGGESVYIASNGSVGIGTANPATNLYVGSGSQATSNMPGISIGNGTTTYSFFSASDQTKQFIAGVDHTITYTKAGTLSNHDHAIITNNTPRIYTKADGNVGVSSVSPAATLDVKKGSSNTNNKLMKVADDVLSVYKVTGLSNHTVTLTCGSYFQAEVVITANQTNGGTYNNLYIRGIWSNNHHSHHWDEIENIGSLSGSSFSIAVSANDVSNSGKLVITHTYSSGSFSQMVVRVTDLYGVHSYSIT